MFGKNKIEETNAALRVMNQVGQGTTINGDVSTIGDVRIDGKVTGSVTSKSKVVVGASGIIEGDIFCQNSHIDGRVSGSVEVTELLFLSKTANVAGDIKIKKLVVEEGAKFNGKCSMGMSVARNNESFDEQTTVRSQVSNAV